MVFVLELKTAPLTAHPLHLPPVGEGGQPDLEGAPPVVEGDLEAVGGGDRGLGGALRSAAVGEGGRGALHGDVGLIRVHRAPMKDIFYL